MSRKIKINDDQLKVFETVPDLYLILSPELQILTASDAYLKSTFTERAEIVGKSMFEVFPDNPDTPQANSVSNLHTSLKQVLATGKPHHMALQRYDVPLPETDGGFEKKYWQPINTPVLDEKGEVLYIIHKAVDVTRQVEDNARIEILEEQQRQDREKLEQQHNLLRMLFDQAPVGMCLSLGMDLVITAANPVVCEMWGYTAEQVLEKPLLDAVPELRGQGFDTLLQNVLQSGIPYYGIEQAAQLLTNGKLETRYFNFTYMALKDGDAATIGVLTVAAEVTEQVLARQQLEQSLNKEQSLNEELAALNEEFRATNEELAGATRALEKLNTELEERVQLRTKELKLAQQETERQRKVLHDLFMDAPAPIVILDGEEMVYQLVNPAYQQIFPGRELLGKPLVEALPELVGTPIPAILDNVFRTGETFVAQELPLMMSRYEGAPLEEIYWTFTYQVRRNQQGAVDGILVFAHDVTDHVLARKKTEESEQQLRSIIESSPFPIGVFFGKEMHIQFANKAIHDSWSKGPNMIGKLYRDVLPELENQAVFEQLDRVFATGIPFHSRNNPLDLLINGRLQTFYYNYSFTPLFNDAGEVNGIINFGVDNTELILAQQRVEESESRFRSMIEQIPVAIGLTRGKDHVFEDMNPPMLRIIGREHKGEVIGKKVTEVMPEITDQAVVKVYQDVLETGKAYTGNEVPVIFRYGDRLDQRYLNISYTPLLEDGKVTGLIHAAVDVTDQVEARKKIEESQEELKRFKFMADQANDLFVLMQEDGSFAYLNKKALGAWGYSEEEIQHLRVPDVDTVYNQEAFLQLFAKAQKENIPQFETQHKTKEGRIFPVEVNVVWLTIGEKPYLFAVARDISKRKQSEEEIKEKNAQLVRINNDLDNFIYTASHDLKAPISNIEALLQALLRTLPPENLSLERPKRITSMMQESVERFKKTIANLTEVVKLQKENSVEAVMVELPKVINDVRLDLEQMIQSAGAEIEVDVADCPTIHFSEKNLRSVVYNLLSNAIKYRAPERVPRVQITCKSTSEYQVLSVKDNGLGMEPRRIDQLFTMFKRFHSHVEGTGIGLYMVKKMVENAGGRIKVESQLGEGTTFLVYFKR